MAGQRAGAGSARGSSMPARVGSVKACCLREGARCVGASAASVDRRATSPGLSRAGWRQARYRDPASGLRILCMRGAGARMTRAWSRSAMLVKTEPVSPFGARGRSPDCGGRSCARWSPERSRSGHSLARAYIRQTIVCGRPADCYGVEDSSGCPPDSSRVYGGTHACCSRAYRQKTT
jgi:hypothetical protein